MNAKSVLAEPDDFVTSFHQRCWHSMMTSSAYGKKEQTWPCLLWCGKLEIFTSLHLMLPGWHRKAGLYHNPRCVGLKQVFKIFDHILSCYLHTNAYVLMPLVRIISPYNLDVTSYRYFFVMPIFTKVFSMRRWYACSKSKIRVVETQKHLQVTTHVIALCTIDLLTLIDSIMQITNT